MMIQAGLPRGHLLVRRFFCWPCPAFYTPPFGLPSRVWGFWRMADALLNSLSNWYTRKHFALRTAILCECRLMLPAATDRPA